MTRSVYNNDDDDNNDDNNNNNNEGDLYRGHLPHKMGAQGT